MDGVDEEGVVRWEGVCGVGGRVERVPLTAASFFCSTPPSHSVALFSSNWTAG